jgi:hypothetical protein
MAKDRAPTGEEAGERERHRLPDIVSTVSVTAVDPEILAFQHSIFCQTGLPYRNPGPEVREWERLNGGASLIVSAGKAFDPANKRWVQLGLPYGPKSRLVLIHLNTEAIRTGSPVVPVEDSLTAFVRRLLRYAPNGLEIRQFKDQLGALAAANIRLGFLQNEEHATTINTQIVHGFNIWMPKDQRQRVLWPTMIRLSHEYFESLKDHAVPLDERAVAALATSCMALDVYCWLAQRLHRVPSGRPLLVPWAGLKAQFGWHYGRMVDFRRDFRQVLAEIRAQYADARFDLDHRGMLLHHSPPPIRPKRVPVPKP